MQLYNRSIKTLESLNFIYRQVQVCSTRNSMEGTMKASVVGVGEATKRKTRVLQSALSCGDKV